MPDSIKTDVLIMGAGVAGLCTAAALSEKGIRTAVVGRRSLEGEASPRAAGIIDPFLGQNRVTPLLRLTLASHRFFPSFVRRLEKVSGVDVEYRRTGMIYVAMNPAETAVLRRTFLWQKRFDSSLRWFEPGTRLFRKFPFISRDAAGAFFYPYMGKVNPVRFVQACEKFASRKGAVILKVEGKAVLSDKDGLFTTKAGPVRVSAPCAVIASGSWSPQVTRHRKFFPVKPVRGQIFVARSGVKIPTIVHSVHDAYLVPREAGDFLLGSTVEFAGYRASTTESAKKKILARLTSIVPSLENARISDAWAGLRPWSRDLKPILGKVPGKRIYAAAGYFRSGLLLGPFCGERLAEVIAGEKTPEIIKPFGPGRFAS